MRIRDRNNRLVLLALILGIGGLFSLCLAIVFGSANLNIAAFFDEFGNWIAGGRLSPAGVIYFELRMPRAILSYLIGGGLAVAGAALQSVFQNPMADCHILGVSAGAGLGAGLAMVLGISISAFSLGAVGLFAFLGGIAAVLLVYGVSHIRGRISTTSLLLAGIAISALCSSVTSGIMILHRDQLDRIALFTMGSFSSAGWKDVLFILCTALPCSLLILPFHRQLDIMLLGREEARMLGVNTAFYTRLLLVLSTIMAAAAVSVSGVIGFVGLMVPHTMRIITGPAHRRLLPASFFGGGLFLCLADTLSRAILPPLELPVGVVTAICGVPFFLVLLHKSNRAAP